MSIAHTQESFASIIHYTVGKIWCGVNLFAKREVWQALRQSRVHCPTFPQHHFFFGESGLLEILSREYDANTGQFVAYRYEPGPVILFFVEEEHVARLFVRLTPTVANCSRKLSEQGDLFIVVSAKLRTGYSTIGQESGRSRSIDQYL